MNIVVNTTTLAQELRLLNHVVPEKPSLPICTHIVINADENVLNFYGTDLEIGFLTSCPASVYEPGTITLPAKRLLSLVEQLPDGELQIQTSGSHVHLLSGAFKSRLQTFEAQDFPTRPGVEGDTSVIQTAVLQSMIAKIRYAVTDKSKYVSNGALLSLTDTVMALIATDGKRLSIVTMPRASGSLGATVIPAKALDAISSLFTNGFLEFSKTDRHLFFVSNGKMLFSRQLEGQFPAYDRVIPRDTNKHVSVSRSQLAAALRRVGVLAEDNQAAYFTFAEGELTISAQSAEAGEALEIVPITYQGEPLKVCCNWRYMLDFLEAAVEERITIDCKEVTTPFLMSEGQSFLNVIMLMR